jgi:hypothetical protein
MGKRDYYYLTHNSSKQIITHNFFLKEQKNYILYINNKVQEVLRQSPYSSSKTKNTS